MTTPLPLSHHQLLSRTKAVVTTGAYSTTADAVLITGHTRYRLHTMGEEGVLPSRKAGAQTRVYDTGALVRDAYRLGRLLLPDVLRTASGERLHETDFAHALTTHQSGTWYTLSRHNHMPPDWPSWAAWYAGNTVRARGLLAEEQRQHREEAESLTARGLTRRRLWCPTLPLGAFGRYQEVRFQMLAQAGAHVRALPGYKLTYAEEQGPVPDLEVLPDAVYVRRYTALGARDGATRVTNPDLVETTREFTQWLYTTQCALIQDFADDRVPA